MHRKPSDFPIRAESARVPPMADAPEGVSLINVSSSADSWRIIQLYSETGLSFEASLSWSAGCGVGSHAEVTISHATHIGLFSRTIQIRVKNLCSQKNTVGVIIADGFLRSSNVYEVCGESTRLPITIPIPPFASRFSVDLDEPHRMSRATIRLLNDAGEVMTQYRGNRQPEGGIWVGSASRVGLSVPPNRRYRVLFHLSL